MHSTNLTQTNLARLLELFPGCVTEARDEHGQLKLAVDFDQLRQELSEHLIEGPQERYHLNWPGKREALLTANAPIAKTLRPCREESVDFDKTRNVFIEGDNLDALKLLQESYLGKVKMIYIDPPYNTGSDFIYEDNFAKSAAEYLKLSNQNDDEGNPLIANKESNGRFHSDWLSMLLPRLKLAKNLLRDDGVVFISIHDVELANLKKLCDEVFGNENFIGQITWKARVKPVNIGEAKYRPQKEVEYVLAYQRLDVPGSFFPLFTGGVRSYPYNQGGRNYRLATILKSNRGVNFRSTMSFSLGEYAPPEGQRWQAGEDVIRQLHDDGYIEFKDGTPFRRYFEDEEGAEHDPLYCFMEIDWSSTSETGKHQLNDLLGNQHGFDTVKPVRLLKTLVQTCTASGENHLILDFFAGSATTAHAILEINSEDGGNRRSILVQAPEPCLTKSSDAMGPFKNVAEIGKERFRRAGDRILAADSHATWNKDIGFRVLKVDSSNMAEVYYRPDELNQHELGLTKDHIKPGRGAEDLLFQVLLDWGVDLSLPIRREQIQKREVFIVDEDALVACFALDLDEALLKALAALKPLRAVFRDNGFASDALRINAEQIFKQLSPGTDVKVI